jgi:metacaspase-1
MKQRLALCVGINDYPGVASDLSGCVNDAHDWHVTLLERGYDVQMLLDSEATAVAIVERLQSRLAQLKFGDRFVFCFSGHGTWVPDRDGDEVDKRDEALCCFDYERGGLLTDDMMYRIFENRAVGSRVTVLSDCCHSGTVSRFALQAEQAASTKGVPKFVSPAAFTDLSETAAARAEAFAPAGKPRSGAVLISGCDDHEFSYDASFEGRPNGAFTYYARQALQQGATRVDDVYANIRAQLPSDQYPQSPQLTVGAFQRRTSLL